MQFFLLLFVLIITWGLSKGYYGLRSRRPKGTRKLPGPRGLPFVGSFYELRKGESGYFWFKLTEWAVQFGSVYQYKAFGKTNVVVNTERIANALLRERGEIYSSRENLPMASQLLSDNKKALFLPYGDEWRHVRKFQHHVTQVKAAASYEPLQSKLSTLLLHDIIQEPDQYRRLFQRYASALILRLTYGIRIETGEEEIVRLVYEVQQNVERVAAPGKYLVDVFPLLMRVPQWLAPFKQEAAAHRRREVALFTKLVEGVQSRIQSGTAGSTFTRTWLENKEKFGLSDLQAAYVMGGLYAAAASTTASLAQSWVLMMVLHPEWFIKVQEELDRVVSPDRLPTFEDLPQLPLVRATVKEVARMRPVTAGGIPHKTTKDDIYEDYFIPKGSIVHPNLWSIHYDPELYPSPERFNPDRWLKPEFPTYREPLTEYPNMRNYSVFGFGRRFCPGAHIAERSINIIAARLGWACDIKKTVDVLTGEEIDPPEYDYVRAMNTEPNHFAFQLTCRSETHWSALESAAREATRELAKPDIV